MEQQDQTPEKITKRQFLILSITAIALFITIALGAPFVAYLAKPFSRAAGLTSFVKVPGFNALGLEKPTKLGFESLQVDGFMRKPVYHQVWVIRHADNTATVFSPICTHLGCQFDWKDGLKQFLCPCHGSVFDISGNVLGGPAPRPLDTLDYRIENNELSVEWAVFTPGITKKEAE
jgi:menaquinol-cytochrome c reductase iron-sulfur subunit